MVTAFVTVVYIPEVIVKIKFVFLLQQFVISLNNDYMN